MCVRLASNDHGAQTQLGLRCALLGALLACTSGGALAPPPPPPPPPGPPPPPPSWKLVWSDEFNGPAGSKVDTTHWNYNRGDGCPGVCGWGNNEREYYTSDTANIQQNGQGQLQIVARVSQDTTVHCYYGTCRYTSAKITTSGKVLPAYGRIEARIKLAAGQGLWPAFWMLGENITTVDRACGRRSGCSERTSPPWDGRPAARWTSWRTAAARPTG